MYFFFNFDVLYLKNVYQQFSKTKIKLKWIYFFLNFNNVIINMCSIYKCGNIVRRATRI